jgi:hypothetical protein
MDEDQLFLHPAAPQPADRPPRTAPQRPTDIGPEFLMEQISRLPTRRELARLALVILFVGAVIGIVGIQATWRYVPRCSADATSPLPEAARSLP